MIDDNCLVTDFTRSEAEYTSELFRGSAASISCPIAVNKKKNVSLSFILHILFDVLLGNNTLFMVTLFDLLDTIVVVQAHRRPRPSQNRPLCLTIVGIHLWRIWQSGNDLARTWQRLGMSEREGGELDKRFAGS